MLKLVLVFVFLGYATGESQHAAQFKLCVQKCTSPNTKDRIQCKLDCSEEMKQGYLREMNEDSERTKKEEGIEVKRCSDQCPSIEEDPINGVEKRRREGEEEKREAQTVVIDSEGPSEGISKHELREELWIAYLLIKGPVSLNH